LEWETLSKYTGNATYGDLTIASVAHIAQLVCLFVGYVAFMRLRNYYHKAAPLPGLAAQVIDPRTGGFNGGYVVRLILSEVHDLSILI
jgi:mannosyl-oligosaccharide alpha-1,2-mannosidase